MRSLYPPLAPNAGGMLDVGGGHRIYWEESGNPRGRPVVYLHGGPGGACGPAQRRLFDPAAYRIVLFDQRGCGRSTPTVRDPGVDLSDNTTWHLVADLETLREHLGVARWQLFGGSWGATLALTYAQTHPERVSELVLRGVFLMRQRELHWLYRGGAGNLFPEAWTEFASLVPSGDTIEGYHRLVNDPDPVTRERAALAWSTWEGAIVSTVPGPGLAAPYADPEYAVPFARIALHYFVNAGWLADGQLLRDAGRLAGIPGRIVQGRYDVVCPAVSAWELRHAWPDSRLCVLPGAGHAITDPGVVDALITATDEFAGRP